MRVRIACGRAAPQCATAVMPVSSVFTSLRWCISSARCSLRSRSTSASCTRASGLSQAPSSSSLSCSLFPTHPPIVCNAPVSSVMRFCSPLGATSACIGGGREGREP
eukprot:2266285-Prymnesium_polylepis.1